MTFIIVNIFNSSALFVYIKKERRESFGKGDKERGRRVGIFFRKKYSVRSAIDENTMPRYDEK